jgi:hypothetical protein
MPAIIMHFLNSCVCEDLSMVLQYCNWANDFQQSLGRARRTVVVMSLVASVANSVHERADRQKSFSKAE